MSDLTADSTEYPTVSHYDYEETNTDCPQGCSATDPLARGMRRVTHHTGEYGVIEIYGEAEVIEHVEHYLECRTCGWMIDL